MSEPVRLAGVVGYPAGHSKSPLIHNHWLKSQGVKGLYAPFEIAPEYFAEFLAAAPKFGFVGVNVTIPHKEQAFALCRERTPVAERCGSVNTITFDAKGQPCGDSTDGFGFIENLRQWAPTLRFAGATVAMLGAGGGARAVVAALLDEGVARLRLANRSGERAEALAEAFGDRVEVRSWPVEDDFYDGASLIVNGTSLGMVGGPAHEWRLPPLGSGVVATDLIYAPLETPFLAAARARFAHIVDGFGMLLHQARPGFERWFGGEAVVTEELREIVLSREGFLP